MSAGGAAPAGLSAAALRRGLHTAIVGREIHVSARVTSTNDVAWELAGRGAEEGTVVLAEEQTAGRGRMGRTWWSPRGGLWLSVLLRPPVRDRGAVPMTTVVGALATTDAIRTVTGLPAMVRWPNDVLIEGRKVAGVLVEAHHGPRGREMVLGVGVNVNIDPAEIPADLAASAASLSEMAGETVDPLRFARTILKETDRWYLVKLARDIESINQRWRELSATLGRRVTLVEDGRRCRGTVIDVDVTVGLALRLDTGSIRHFRGEHVSVEWHE